ncbi:MAG TPA: 3-phosphoglycerate dehydrogenase [Candidatus Aminicenantes bacterium]|nr:3-phosphoglycerate dehydrogenase [Candidatus Aminicenantes bacterium]
MKQKVLVATVKPFHPDAVTGIRDISDEAGYEMVLLESYANQAEFEAAVADADALIIRSDKVTPEVIAAADRLKIVVRAGAGYDNVDLDAATAKGIVVMNTPGQNANAVAELAMGMMVYLARNGFNGKAGTELRGKTLGIHAFGNVGRDVARIAGGFGMDVFAFDPFVEDAVIRAEGVTPLGSVEELYSQCQYVSLHIPANEKTRGSINRDLLARMPEGAVLVNTARKEVVCEESLREIFRKRPDFKYISDVAPDCKDEIAAEFAGRFFFTPKKMGAQTTEANINAGLAAIRQIIAFFEKGDRTFQVNR